MIRLHFRCEVINFPQYFINLPQNFTTSLSRYELSLFSKSNANELLSKVLNSLGVGVASSQIISGWHGNSSSIDTSRACSVICAYRLLDVIALLGGGDPAPVVERSPFMAPIGSFRVCYCFYLFFPSNVPSGTR